ncbi:2-hydroxyacid dehydrogenase [Terrisporobacter mayombei]|uniref:2-hydroxyacid dehydrogenase YoaD n=1 Tax=Terrisporobacter mayombei TaxID=1541 RepID=A0ABY9PWJ0_9FIRM|nr:2-hydroxyacid dehydrogenase [Terrisporobacter mayombei]MCC3867898.1 2-hydroxyacid dehydrogenase [Terrisporobacter mayombei]WMT80032.1 Putative 2-hydroxyacid dehydrogenase YoaD [Terrisporobacter mayombei]
MKLLVRAPIIEERRKELEEMFEEVIYEPWTDSGERYYEDEMLEVLNKYEPDALITELDRITEKVVTNYTKLKVIGDCRANPANIDVQACNKANIPILCTPARNAQAVAEMLVGLLITYMRNIPQSMQWIKDGKWVEGTTPYYSWMGNELQGKSIGFVGFGAVGQSAAKMLESFGMKISFYDPFVENRKENYIKEDLESIFKKCDIVSIHLPVLESTKNMINMSLLSLMKPEAIFVNTARTAVVNNKDLYNILSDKKIKGAILDVLETEPPTKEDLKIVELDNVLLTPHICGATHEVTDHQSDIITERLKKWLKKEDLDKIVFNKQILL